MLSKNKILLAMFGLTYVLLPKFHALFGLYKYLSFIFASQGDQGPDGTPGTPGEAGFRVC